MSVLYLMIPMALLLAGAALFAFIRSVQAGQYDELDTPGARAIFDDDEPSGHG